MCEEKQCTLVARFLAVTDGRRFMCYPVKFNSLTLRYMAPQSADNIDLHIFILSYPGRYYFACNAKYISEAMILWEAIQSWLCMWVWFIYVYVVVLFFHGTRVNFVIQIQVQVVLNAFVVKPNYRLLLWHTQSFANNTMDQGQLTTSAAIHIVLCKCCWFQMLRSLENSRSGGQWPCLLTWINFIPSINVDK